MFKEDNNINEIRNLYPEIKIDISEQNNYLKILLEKEVDIITPGLNRVFDDPYIVKVERVIYND